MILREIAVKLGLDVDAASFAKGELAAHAVELGLEKLVEWGKEAVKSFIELATHAVEVTDEIDKTAQAVGVSTATLQELAHAGSLAGVGITEMSQSIGILSRTMLHASQGGEEQGKVFAKLGVKVKDAHGKLRAADEVMASVADKFKSMPDGAEKTATAMLLFGRAGKRMIPLLNEGSEGLAEMRQEARDLGIVLDETTIKQGVAIHDNVKRLQGLWEGIKNKAGATIFPLLKQITDGLITWVKANKELIKQRLEQVLGFIARAAMTVFEAFKAVYGAFRLVYDIVAPLVKFVFAELLSVLNLIGPAGREAALIFAAGWALALAPILGIAAAIGGIVLILNSIQRFREGKDSLFGDWMKMLNEWSKPNGDDPWWLKSIKELVQYMQQAMGIAEKLGIAPKKQTGGSSGSWDSAPVPGSSMGVPSPILGAGNREVFDPWANYRRAKSQGAGFWSALSANDSDYPAPTLPSGQGVLKAPVMQSNQNNFQIYASPGMSPQDVADLVGQKLDDVHESAHAALAE